MSALLAWFLSNPTVIAFGLTIIGGIGWGFHQRLAGAQAERNKQADEQAAATSEAQKIDDAIAGRAPDANRTELGRWSKS